MNVILIPKQLDDGTKYLVIETDGLKQVVQDTENAVSAVTYLVKRFCKDVAFKE